MSKKRAKRGGALLAPRATLNRKELFKLVANECKYAQYEVQDVLEAYYKVLYDALVMGKDVHIEGVVKLRHRINPARWLKSKQKVLYLCKPSKTVKAVMNDQLQIDTKEYFQTNVLPGLPIIDEPLKPEQVKETNESN